MRRRRYINIKLSILVGFKQLLFWLASSKTLLHNCRVKNQAYQLVRICHKDSRQYNLHFCSMSLKPYKIMPVLPAVPKSNLTCPRINCIDRTEIVPIQLTKEVTTDMDRWNYSTYREKSYMEWWKMLLQKSKQSWFIKIVSVLVHCPR